MEWIKLEKRKPKLYDEVLVLFDKENEISIGTWNGKSFTPHDSINCSGNDCNGYQEFTLWGKVIYWMPLPEKPRTF